MTNPRGYTYDPNEPAEVAGRDAWLTVMAANGWTQQSEDTTRTTRTAWVYRPLPSLPAPLGPSEHGVDVSHWQNTIDWPRVRADGYRFAYVKVTQGTDITDSRGQANRAGAQAAGMHVGCYHYFEHDRDGEQQARHFSAAIGEEVPRLTPAVDFEVSGQPRLPLRPREEITVQLKRFLDTLEALGLGKAVIYTNGDSIGQMTTRPAWLAAYPLWLADWTPPMNVPAPWTHARFWQKGKRAVAGVVGECDFNEYLGDAPAPVLHTMADKTNQQVINLFDKVFGGWSQLDAAIPDWVAVMVGPNNVNRNKLYTGPAIEEMPLTPAEQAALVAGL